MINVCIEHLSFSDDSFVGKYSYLQRKLPVQTTIDQSHHKLACQHVTKHISLFPFLYFIFVAGTIYLFRGGVVLTVLALLFVIPTFAYQFWFEIPFHYILDLTIVKPTIMASVPPIAYL